MLLQNTSSSLSALGPVHCSAALHRILVLILVTIQTGSNAQVRNLHSVLRGQEKAEKMRGVLPFASQ